MTRKMLSAHAEISNYFHSRLHSTAGLRLAHRSTSSSARVATSWFQPEGASLSQAHFQVYRRALRVTQARTTTQVQVFSCHHGHREGGGTPLQKRFSQSFSSDHVECACIHGDHEQLSPEKTTSILDEVERRSAIPRNGKVLIEDRTIEENNIGTETMIEMSLRLLGGTSRASQWIHWNQKKMETKKGKLAEVSEGKLARPSEDALFLKQEIIDALKRSEEKAKKRWKSFYKKSRIQSEHNYTG